MLAFFTSVLRRWWKILRVVVEMVWFYVKIAPFGLRMYHNYFISRNRTKDVRLDLAYGPLPRNRVDVYTRLDDTTTTTATNTGLEEDEASTSTSAGAPLVIFVHGGAWHSGGKHQYGTLARALQARGLVVAVANYTLHPAGQVQQMVRDLALLLKFIERHAHSFGADLRRVCVVGHSAGAHLLALYMTRLAMLKQHGEEVGLTEHYHSFLDETHLLSDITIQAFVGIGGPYHIADHYEHESYRGVENLSAMKPAMGGIPNFAHHSPTALLEEFELRPGSLPPTYLLHGTVDGTVPSSSSVRFAETLKKQGHDVELHLVEGMGHSDFILHLMNDRSPKHRELMDLLASLLLRPPSQE